MPRLCTENGYGQAGASLHEKHGDDSIDERDNRQPCPDIKPASIVGNEYLSPIKSTEKADEEHEETGIKKKEGKEKEEVNCPLPFWRNVGEHWAYYGKRWRQ